MTDGNCTLQTVHTGIEKLLETASNQNAKLNTTLTKMGVFPKPTVSEWLKDKQEQKKESFQKNLVFWDINKSRREETIKRKQILTLERASKHAAWETEKNIQQQIKSIRSKRINKIGNPITNNVIHSPTPSKTGM